MSQLGGDRALRLDVGQQQRHPRVQQRADRAHRRAVGQHHDRDPVEALGLSSRADRSTSSRLRAGRVKLTSATAASRSATLGGVARLVLGDPGDHVVVELLHDPEQADARSLGHDALLSVSDALEAVQQLHLRAAEHLVQAPVDLVHAVVGPLGLAVGRVGAGGRGRVAAIAAPMSSNTPAATAPNSAAPRAGISSTPARAPRGRWCRRTAAWSAGSSRRSRRRPRSRSARARARRSCP